MDEFIVVKVMNEATLRLKKQQNEDCSINERIKVYLKDEDFFSKIDKDVALKVLTCIGVTKDKLDETYEKLMKKFK